MTFPEYSNFAPLELDHVLVVGQSNALGGGSSVALSTRQKYRNRMFRGGVLMGTSGNNAVNYSEMVPLLEPLDTLATGFSDFVAFKSGGRRAVLVSNNAEGNATYAQLAKGTSYYNLGLRHVREFRQRMGNRGVMRGLLSVHGEADAASGTYATDIRQWQVDYETDINARSGRTGILPIFHTQAAYPGFASMASALAMLAEYKTNPTKTLLVGPRYFLPHIVDGAHLTSESHRRMGEYYAKAFYQHVFQGVQWVPLYPSNVVRAGAVITITFSGNVGSLVLDTTNVSNPGNFGFSYTDDTATASVSSVALQSTNQVVVTLNTTPTGANKKVRYGFNGATEGGPTTGRRGCLRDQDPEASPNGNSLVNWCCYFDEAAT